MMDAIEINDNNVHSILDMLNKKIDSDGYIVEKKSDKRVKCPYSKESIHHTKFSIMPGSFIFINNYSYCFTEHMAKYNLG